MTYIEYNIKHVITMMLQSCSNLRWTRQRDRNSVYNPELAGTMFFNSQCSLTIYGENTYTTSPYFTPKSTTVFVYKAGLCTGCFWKLRINSDKIENSALVTSSQIPCQGGLKCRVNVAMASDGSHRCSKVLMNDVSNCLQFNEKLETCHSDLKSFLEMNAWIVVKYLRRNED